MSANKNFRLAKLEAKHFSTYQVLTTTPQSLTTLAAALGITASEATRRLSLLVDEGLAVAPKGVRGAPLRTYRLAA